MKPMPARAEANRGKAAGTGMTVGGGGVGLHPSVFVKREKSTSTPRVTGDFAIIVGTYYVLRQFR